MKNYTWAVEVKGMDKLWSIETVAFYRADARLEARSVREWDGLTLKDVRIRKYIRLEDSRG